MARLKLVVPSCARSSTLNGNPVTGHRTQRVAGRGSQKNLGSQKVVGVKTWKFYEMLREEAQKCKKSYLELEIYDEMMQKKSF